MWEIILNIVLALLSVTLAGVTYYLDVKKKILESVNDKVNEAEDTGEDGKAKMAMVVNEIYTKIVPTVLKPVFNKKVLEKLVQVAWEKIEKYAEKQAEKEKNKNKE